ncbi:hypothetical protein BD779DRAFT_659978 [Infundibulicybe gibba]|nr:hypothetical protein BD779DRAFT_659978 [Infundibulicybe gibba]
MMDDQPEAESSAMAKRSMLNGRRHASAMDQLESPVPKRRRVSKVLGSGTSISRVRSALDVLADQADQALAVGPGSGPRRGIDDNYDGDGGATVSEVVGPESSQEAREGRKAKGKGKEKEKDTAREDAKQKTKPKATPVKRVRMRAPPKEKPTPKGKARASNSESAIPRMISPPALHDGGARAPGQLYMPDGASPTKMAPGSGRGTPWKGRTRPRPSDTADTSFDEQARVSLRPVTGWGERSDEEEKDRTDTPTRSQEIDTASSSATDRPGLVQPEANSDNTIPKSTAGGDLIHHSATNQLEPGVKVQTTTKMTRRQ